MTMKAIGDALKKRVYNSAFGLPADSFGILMIIHYQEGLTQQELADFLRKDKSTVQRLIDTMEEKRLVQRIIDPTDKRKNNIAITQSGKEVINDICAKEKKMFRDLAKGINASDMLNFQRVLIQLRKNAEKG